MRILLYGYEYPPLGGGVGNALKNILVMYSNEKGVEIDFVTSSLSNTWEEEQLYKNIRMYKVPTGKVKTKETYHIQTPKEMILFSINAYLLTWKLIFKNRYDLSHFFGYPGGLVSLMFKWKMPYIVSLRGVDVPGYNEQFKKFYGVYSLMSKIVWKYASRVISNSNGLADLAYKTYPKLKIDIIPNGIDTKKWKPVSEDKKVNIFTVTAGGTLMNPKKGLQYLVKGFAKFNRKHPDTRLVLMTSGGEEDKLRKQVSDEEIIDSVEFTGFLENNKIAEILPTYHVFCLPSITESMSNASLEALASGLPLIITGHGANNVILNDNGFLIRKKSSEDIFEKLNILYEKPEKRIAMGKKSREIAEELTWEKVAKEYLKVYRDVKS
jgi:L-malate glycosyltransferase